MNDNVDVVQVRDKNSQLVHALMWSLSTIGHLNQVFLDQTSPNAVQVSSSGLSDRVVTFVNGDHKLASSFQVGLYNAASTTPGLPNSPANAAYIDGLKPNVCAGSGVLLGCSEDPDYCYIWEVDGITMTPVRGAFYGVLMVFPTNPRTVYRRIILDSDGNIVGENSYIVNTVPAPEVSVQQEQLTTADCIEEAMFKFTAEVGSMNGSYTYQWSSGHTTPEVQLLGDQIYTLTVTASNGCETVKTVVPQGDPAMHGAVNIVASTPYLCGNDPLQLTASFSNYSGNGTRTYQWSNGATTGVTQVTVPGEYRVTVTTSAGCTFSDTIEIQPAFDLIISADFDQACAEHPARLSAEVLGSPGLGLLFRWSNGAFGEDLLVYEAGTYTVELITSYGCTISKSYTIEGGVEMTLSASTERLVPNGLVTIAPTLSGGIPPFTYAWSSGSTADQLAVNVAGTYSLTVTDQTGCSAIDEVTILPHDQSACEGITVALNYHAPDCENYGSARLETVLPSGFTASSYSWSSGGTSSDLLIDNGNVPYGVTVTATNGCQAVGTITPPAFQSLNNSSAVVPLCELVHKLEVVSLAGDQAFLVFENVGQQSLNTLLAASPTTRVEVVAEYESNGNTVSEVIPFAGPGLLPDPATWAGNLIGIAADAEITVRMQTTDGAFCPVICTASKVLINPGAIDSVEVVLEEEPEILLTNYECGDVYVADSTATNTEPLLFLTEGEVITVNGFPLLIKTLVQQASSEGSYQGTGLVPLPFNDRNLLVSFAGKVNKFRTLYDGLVEGMEDNLSNYDFSVDTLAIGGDICIPQEIEGEYDENGINPVTGLDRFGFDSLGINVYTGNNLDTLGFDANGNHVTTGTQYNEQGCNREGRDASDNPCNPQRYIDAATQQFIDSIGSQLSAIVNAQMAAELATVQQDLQTRRGICNNLRGEMQAIRESLQFAEPYIYGDSSQYFNPGLSQKFAIRPDTFSMGGVTRDPLVVSLEKKHVLLDSCDRAELELIRKEAMVLGADAAAALSYVLSKLSSLNAEQIGPLRDPAAFAAWVRSKVKEYLDTLEQLNGSVGNFEPSSREEYDNGTLWAEPKNYVYAAPSHQFTDFPALASISGDLGFADRAEMIRYELNTQFKQGFRAIQGVHRAHFLAKLAQMQAASQDTSGQGSNLLPISVTKYIGGLQYTILLDDVKFNPISGATLSAYLILEDPDSGQKLVFEGTNITFGVGGADGSRLSLASTVAIRINNATKLILDAGQTFVDWDCSGFAGMAVGGKVELCREFITPLDDNTLNPLPDPARFHLNFNTYVTEWLDAVVTVDAGAFALTNNEGIKWRLDSAVVDLSDRITPQFVPTDGYSSQHYDRQVGFSPLWRGFYLANLSATLPNDFSEGADPVTVGVEDVLIDGTGFSGEAYVEGVNLLDIGTGNAGGWPFGIDRFNIKVLHNSFAGAGFGGGIIIPVFTDTLRYSANIYRHGRYKFTVQPEDTVKMNMLLAEVELLPATKIEIGYDYDGFLAVADLTGNMRFKVPDTSIVKLTLPELYFKEFRVSNRDPYFDAGMWEIRNLGVNMDFGGFAMDLSRISPYKGSTSREFGLGFDLSIGLVSELEIAAGGRFGILGELEEINDRQKWKFKRIDLKGLFIDANIKDVMHVSGSLQWFNDDPDYGKGFYAMLEAEFTKKPLNFSAQVAAQFGKREDTKYFFVDAMVGLASGVPIGPLKINGFGGGVSYHMHNTLDISKMNFGGNGAHAGMPNLGESFSGATYTVAPQYGLGLKAAVMVATAESSVFNGWAGLEFLFNDRDHGGGLATISFKGQGQFMADILPDPPQFMQTLSNNISAALPIDEVPGISQGNGTAGPPISAWVDLTYNFNEGVFDGKLEAYLRGGGLLMGAGPNGRLVQAALHVDSEDWYINIGTPTAPAGILVDLPYFNAGATAYFNMGTDIPDFPGLPENVLAMANLINTNESLRKSGGGIMFGARIFAEARLKAGPVQGFLEADMGFDLMLRNYGSAICAGSNQQIGLNGWYAAGQAWVYLNGGVKLFGVSIFEAGIAGVMQARLPNPFWAKATLAARVKLLFVEKKINLNVEIGEQCSLIDPDGGVVNENPLINYISPLDKAPGVAPDARPEVYFTVPIGRVFNGPDGQPFSATVTEHNMKTVNGGHLLSHNLVWSDDRTSATLVPLNMFGGGDSIRVTITVTVKKGNTVERTETQTVTFATAAAYDFIPATNVAYSYPVDGMYDFYPKEYSQQKGFIQLKTGQAPLLYNLPSGVENKVILTSATGAVEIIPFTYDASNRLITFDLPPAKLLLGQLYQLKLVRYDGKDIVKEILAPIHFRVSNQERFTQKIALMQQGNMTIQPTTGSTGFIGRLLNQNALLGDVERLGIGVDEPLVRFQAALGTPYDNALEALQYTGFPINPDFGSCEEFTTTGAGNFESLGEAAGVSVSAFQGPLVISGDHFTNGLVMSDRRQVLEYNVPQEAYADYLQLQSRISTCVNEITEEFYSEPRQDSTVAALNAYILSYITQRADNFYNTPFLIPGSGLYYIRVSYHLPNGTQTTQASYLELNYTRPSGGGGPTSN
ncbi:hypothetical protein QWY85_03765 [Neolewinella lacunae]|uniref:PKD domain-containing protein n=1 Tax=Neolewinella lacunae TaxID=1517758 RepID=A0A923T6R8_9BACT|nr:hypothetical protein [Neolewinella lacunae]MBC6992876.1 hypothetical protein [Neolewinella lacunae]MDN3633760.1 hypothetical protein [Neolewinella lacunae]